MALEKLLQLIHVSDLHVIDGMTEQANAASGRAALYRRFRFLPSWARDYFVEKFMPGLQGHDSEALEELVDMVDDSLRDEPEWSKRTHLVCTGDLSTWGDATSIRMALHGLAAVQGVSLVSLYGNHDVWPGAGLLPSHRSDSALARNRSTLRDPNARLYGPHFSGNFPLTYPALRVPLRHAKGGHLCVYALDTIIHESRDNDFALGRVREDRYWENVRPRPQLAELASLSSAPEIRVVLTHHPVHDPSVPMVGHVLLNNDQVALALASPEQAGTYHRTAYVVLSGHTHKLFPAHGQLPNTAPTGWQCHAPLDDGQVQLTTGTLSQRSYAGRGGDHVVQVIRFYEDTTAPRLVVGRIVFERNNGTGPFLATELPNGGVEQHLSIDV
jgi:3',5'-cyclic AMP phosphodiesterase CpdA